MGFELDCGLSVRSLLLGLLIGAGFGPRVIWSRVVSRAAGRVKAMVNMVLDQGAVSFVLMPPELSAKTAILERSHLALQVSLEDNLTC